jgi:hypothetical protein
MPETVQLVILSTGTVVIFMLILAAIFLERHLRETSPRSAQFNTAGASTNFSKKLDRILGRGVEILMPAGHGRYPLTVSEWRRRKWRQQFQKWLDRGVRITIIITSPNERAIEYWQSEIDRLSPELRVCLLDRKLASPQDALEIQRMDTFHPIVVVKGMEPLAMWIESQHDPDSSVAYNVQYVAAEDIVDDQRTRFDRLLSILRRLTDESSKPPHLKLMSPSNKGSSAKKADSLIAA